MGAKRNGASIRRRILARRLRELREGARLTLDEAAPALDTSASRLSRIENGQQKADVHLVKSMLDLYDAGDQWAEMLELAREAAKPGWYRAYGRGDDSYIGYETEAVRVHEYSVGFVPGLLQVPEYARGLYDSSMVLRTVEERERALTVRMIRQQRLHSTEDPLHLEAIIDEAVLRNPIGGLDAQRSQLAHLVTAAELPTVDLKVLPAASGAHGGLGSGFVILDFGDLDEPDMAYVEHALGATHLVKEQDLVRARLVFDQLRSLALAPAESVAFIRRVAAELQTAEGDAVHENALHWRTSSFSGVNGNSCVEVAPLPEGVAVRDTKDRARTPHLHSAAAWRSFVTAVRNREFDRS